jgi:serine/threonine protein kinase
VRLHKVGQGTFSSVYKALDTATGRHVALKKVRLDVCDEEAVLFATREVRPRLPWRGQAACCARPSRGGKLTPSLSTFAALPQVLALRRVDHPNVRAPLMASHPGPRTWPDRPVLPQVLKILAVAVPPQGSDTALYLVLDYHPHDLAGALASRAAAAGGAPLPEGAAKSYVQQLLCAPI